MPHSLLCVPWFGLGPSDHVFATIQPGASAADVHCDRVVEEPAFVFAAHWLHNL